MTYERRIKRWVVVRILPSLRHVDVARFYRFSDAEGYAQLLRQLNLQARYEVIFDVEEG